MNILNWILLGICVLLVVWPLLSSEPGEKGESF